MGRQLAGSRIGIIGYGSIGRYLAPLAKALGMEVMVADPFAKIDDPGIEHVPLDDLLAVPTTSCVSRSPMKRPRT